MAARAWHGRITQACPARVVPGDRADAPDAAVPGETAGHELRVRKAKEGPLMAHVYRADTVGSLLRPQYLKLAREQFEAGQLAAAAYKEIEDRAVDQAIAMQEAVGLDVVTDGELRRHAFIDQLTEQVEGLTLDPGDGDSDHIPVPLHDESGALKFVFTIPLSITSKLRRRRMMTVEEYSYARARARRPVKVTLPSPLMLFLVWSPRRSRDAYRDPFELFADGLRLMREEAEELARLGCRYIQVDAPDFGGASSTAALTSPAANGRSWPSRGLTCATRNCWFSTSRQRLWTRGPSTKCSSALPS